MSDDKKVVPKGAKKGGKRFPMYSLGEALKWSAKLVSKTHNSGQPADIIKASVVDSKSSVGDVKISVLKQFGLMEGDSKQYRATSLAKAINSSPPEEVGPLLSKAALKPEIFRQLFATFHGDEISLGKLRQRAADLEVHPDNAGKCVDVYVESLATAGLVAVQGDSIRHVNEEGAPSGVEEADGEDNASSDLDVVDDAGPDEEEVEHSPLVRRGVATVQVNIALDSSLDTEKLQRQLELLRKFGAI